jgi:hypothetical protein
MNEKWKQVPNFMCDHCGSDDIVALTSAPEDSVFMDDSAFCAECNTSGTFQVEEDGSAWVSWVEVSDE